MVERTLKEKVQEKLKNLPIVGPYRKHINNYKAKIDLSDNLNHFLTDSYPPFESVELKTLYKRILIEDNENLGFIESEGYDLIFINGGLEAFSSILKTFSRENDLVLTFSPTFPFYRDISLRFGLRFKVLDLDGENFDQVNVENIKDTPEIIILCDPNNPISTKLSSFSIEQLLKKFRNSLVVIDEAYVDFSDFPSNLRFLEFYKNLLIIRGFSKGWGMAGLRLCPIFGEKKIIECLRRSCVPYPISMLSLKQSLFNLQFDKEKIKRSWKDLKNEREKLISALKTYVEIKVFPSSTNFICMSFKGAEDFYNYLLKKGILVMSISSALKDSIRVTVGTRLENDVFLKELNNFLGSNLRRKNDKHYKKRD